MFVITREWLDANKTPNGGYRLIQVRALGFKHPYKGWLKESVGNQITDEAKAVFEAGSISKSALRKASKKAGKAKKLKIKPLGKSYPPVVYTAKQIIERAKRTVDVKSDAFLQTYEWRVLRLEALKLHGAACQCCGASRDTGAVMHVDHVKPRKLFPELALDINNLQVLCHECNHGKGNHDMTDWRPFNPRL